MQQLISEILAATFSIYVFTETALHETVQSTEVFPSDFVVYRCDRSEKMSKKSSKGGVLVAVEKSFDSELITTYEENGYEQVWVKVSRGRRKIVIASIYILPSQPIEVYQAHMECINKIVSGLKPDCDVLIYGDFNLPRLEWQIDEITKSMIPLNLSSV